MDLLRTYYINKYRDEPEVQSVLFVRSKQKPNPIDEGFDKLVLIFHKKQFGCHDSIIYYPQGNEHVKERWVSCEQAESSLCDEEVPYLLQWLLSGEIVVDEDGFIKKIKEQLQAFPDQLRMRKLLVEFARFLRSYTQCKNCLESDQLHDAYHFIMEAMYRWARIVILEQGHLPDFNVWKQVKQMNPGVYKLYEELAESTETLRQRIELVLLASEFSVISRMDKCTRYIIEVIGSRKEAWNLSELIEHMKLPSLKQDLSIVLNKMAELKLINAIRTDNGYYSIIKYKI